MGNFFKDLESSVRKGLSSIETSVRQEIGRFEQDLRPVIKQTIKTGGLALINPGLAATVITEEVVPGASHTIFSNIPVIGPTIDSIFTPIVEGLAGTTNINDEIFGPPVPSDIISAQTGSVYQTYGGVPALPMEFFLIIFLMVFFLLK